MPQPIVRHPARLAPIPADKLDSLLPEGNVVTIKRFYAGEMQAETVHRWHRDYLMSRIAQHGAFYAAPFKGSDPDESHVGIPTADGGFIFVMRDKPAEPQRG